MQSLYTKNYPNVFKMSDGSEPYNHIIVSKYLIQHYKCTIYIIQQLQMFLKICISTKQAMKVLYPFIISA